MHKKLNIPLQRCQLNHIDGHKSVQIKFQSFALSAGGEMQARKNVINDESENCTEALSP